MNERGQAPAIPLQFSENKLPLLVITDCDDVIISFEIMPFANHFPSGKWLPIFRRIIVREPKNLKPKKSRRFCDIASMGSSPNH